MCGDDGWKATPVPIPNTEVKLPSADCSEGFPFVRVGRCRAFYKKFFPLIREELFCVLLTIKYNKLY